MLDSARGIRVSHVETVEIFVDRTGEILPNDYAERVPKRGDHVRDTFTKSCIYLGQRGRFNAQDIILVASDYGNTSALERFHHSCTLQDGQTPSAVSFASATTSSAATSLNIHFGVKGGNFTINAGRDNFPQSVLMAQLLLQNAIDGAAVHLFLGELRKAPESRRYVHSVYSRLESVIEGAGRFSSQPPDNTEADQLAPQFSAPDGFLVACQAALDARPLVFESGRAAALFFLPMKMMRDT